MHRHIYLEEGHDSVGLGVIRQLCRRPQIPVLSRFISVLIFSAPTAPAASYSDRDRYDSSALTAGG